MAKLNNLYLEYLNYGGFPEALSSEQIRDQPEQYIGQDILDKVLGRDLPSIFGIRNPNELNKLFAALAYNTANEVSPEGISQSSGVPKAEINRYIEFLEAAFLVRVIHKTDNSLKKFQRRTHYKVVLTNPSLRSAIFGKITPEDQDLESLAETAVYSQLIIHDPTMNSFKYAKWNRGNSKGEVDLVHVTAKGEAKAALEIKWSDRYANDDEKPKSLIAFCKDNELSEACITSKTIFSERNYSGIKITHIPTSFLCFMLGMFGGLKEFALHLTAKLQGMDKNQLTNPENLWADGETTLLEQMIKCGRYIKPELSIHMSPTLTSISLIFFGMKPWPKNSTSET